MECISYSYYRECNELYYCEKFCNFKICQKSRSFCSYDLNGGNEWHESLKTLLRKKRFPEGVRLMQGFKRLAQLFWSEVIIHISIEYILWKMHNILRSILLFTSTLSLTFSNTTALLFLAKVLHNNITALVIAIRGESGGSAI